MTATWLEGPALDVVRTLPDASVDLVASSPPFLALRNYNGVDGQWGSEPTPAAFLANLLDLAVELRRVLTPTGSLAFELGDTFAGSGGAGGDYNEKGTKAGQPKFSGSALSYRKETLRNRPTGPGWPLTKSLTLTPSLFAASLAYGRNLLAPDQTFEPWRIRNMIVWARCLDGDTVVYARTPKGDGPARLLHLTQNWRPGQWQLWDGQRWADVTGWEATEATDAIEIEFRNGEKVNATRNHQWPTARGLLRTDELVIGDVVPTVRLPEPAAPLDPSGLPDDMIGWFVGMYLAEGSLDSRGRIQITGHRNEADYRLGRLRELAEAYHGTATAHRYQSTNATTIVVRSEVLHGVLARYIDGKNARTKHLAPACWQRSDAFLRAVVQGYLEGDGGYDAKNDRWRLGFTDNPWLARDLRVACARIGATCRLRRVRRHPDDRAPFANATPFIWRGEIRFGFASEAHVRPAGQVVALRPSKRRRFFDVSVAGDPHLFALGSGILTHNSNPPVGALGDKVRPATSYITVACPSPRRWFDLDAVRTAPLAGAAGQVVGHRVDRGGYRGISDGGPRGDVLTSHPAGAPPLDHWHDEYDGDHTWLINTQGSSLAHYAMWPAKLAERLILAMCPREVCRDCGEPRRRLTERTPEYAAARAAIGDFKSGRDRAAGLNGTTQYHEGRHLVAAENVTTGWSVCACPTPTYRPGTVLDPFSGTGTTVHAAEVHGRDGIGIDLDPINATLRDRRRDEVRRNLLDVAPEVPGQLTLEALL